MDTGTNTCTLGHDLLDLVFMVDQWQRCVSGMQAHKLMSQSSLQSVTVHTCIAQVGMPTLQ